MKRSTSGLVAVLTTVFSVLMGCTGNQAVSVSDGLSVRAHDSAADPLLFPKDSFTVETRTVRTSAGKKKVTRRLRQQPDV